MTKNRIPEIINESIRNKWTNVFFVTSPIVSVMVKMIILKYKLKPENVLLVSFRNTDLTIFKNSKKIFITINRFNSIFERLFFISLSGIKILSLLNGFNNKNFIVFSTWAYRELNWCVSSKKCSGHIYIEEGQATYMNYIPYSRGQLSIWKKLIFNFKNRINPGDGSGYFYRDDAKAYIGINKNAYPKINNDLKYILNNIYSLKNYYKPKLLGSTNIGLTCASRRLKGNKIDDMFLKLIQIMPKNSFIKLHPSFSYDDLKIKESEEKIKNLSNESIGICSNDTILELEMLYEKKYIYGPQTSLKIYADLLGSEFRKIDLY